MAINSWKKDYHKYGSADMRKEGAAYDLTLAMGILAASGQIKADEISSYLIMGELSLDGSLKPIKGALPIAIQAREQGFDYFILPSDNSQEAAIVEGIEILGATHISKSLIISKEPTYSSCKINKRASQFRSRRASRI